MYIVMFRTYCCFKWATQGWKDNFSPVTDNKVYNHHNHLQLNFQVGRIIFSKTITYTCWCKMHFGNVLASQISTIKHWMDLNTMGSTRTRLGKSNTPMNTLTGTVIHLQQMDDVSQVQKSASKNKKLLWTLLKPHTAYCTCKAVCTTYCYGACC